jgi:trans-aconitate methyltransferase
MNRDIPAGVQFDDYAGRYNLMLDKALAPTRETRDYFARGRVVWLRGRLDKLGIAPSSVVDFGCGTGGSVASLLGLLHCRRVLGLDISIESIRQARKEHPQPTVEFSVLSDYAPKSEFDLAFCNGVFHHIRPEARPAALGYVYDLLKPGGIFALWENNPWNPGTRWIMRRCEFDREAMTISLPQTKALLRGSGYEVLEGSSCFYFPRWLKPFRPLESALARLPLGGQYLVVARKPH